MVDLLMLHRQTNIDALINSVPTPKNSVPINALPGWDQLPLACKLPMLHCPANSIIFSRNRLGRKLDNSSAIIFRLSESFGRPKYEPLHDPHLRKFLYNNENLQLLQRHGQVTYYNDVICSLKEFNEYRQYLNQIRLEQVNEERVRLDAEAKDRLLFMKAQKVAVKKFCRSLFCVSQHIRREEHEAARQEKILRNLERQKEQGLARQAEQEKLQSLKQEVHELKEIQYQERRRRVEEAVRLKAAKLKHKLRMRDLQRLKIIEKRRIEDADEKAQDEMQEWFMMVQKRHEHQKRNELLLSKYEVEMKARVANRIYKIGLVRERVKHKILQTKMTLIRSRYENMELQRLIQVVKEEIDRKVKKEKLLKEKFKLTDATERAGLSPLVAPFRTPEESQKGLGDAPSGYEAIDEATISQVVKTCSQNEQIINGKNYTTMEVLLASKYIFDRLASGTTDDLPNDPDVLKYALILVDSVISRAKERIYTSMVGMIKKENESFNEASIKVKSTSTIKNVNKMSRMSNMISFKDPCEKLLHTKSKSLVLEKFATLRAMTRSALQTPTFHDDIPIPDELEDEKLFHLSQQQKILIVRNLHNLEMMLMIRLEQNVVARFDLKSMVIKPCTTINSNCRDKRESELTDEIYNNLIGNATASILTKPELDNNFSHNILALSDYIAQKILFDLQDYLDYKSFDEEEQSEEDDYEDNDMDEEYNRF